MKTKYEATMANGKTVVRNSTNPDLRWFGFAVKAKYLTGSETLEYCESQNWSVAMRAEPDGLLFPRPLVVLPG